MMKLAPLAREFLLIFAFFPFLFSSGYSYFYVDSSEEEEKEEPAVHGTARTSMSNTLVLSEEHHTTAESSPPPQQNMETSTPAVSSRALVPKKARTGAGDAGELVAGSSTTLLLDDVSPFCFP
jgi:hypothetical protein